MRVPVVAVLLSLAPALAAPQSLGDAARRQARKRTTEAPAAKVYTGEDLRPETDAPAAVPGETETAAADARPHAVRLSATGGCRARAARPRGGGAAEAGALLAAASPARRTRASQSAQREHDTVCGPGVLVLTGG